MKLLYKETTRRHAKEEVGPERGKQRKKDSEARARNYFNPPPMGQSVSASECHAAASLRQHSVGGRMGDEVEAD